jgi:hypothetical protein
VLRDVFGAEREEVTGDWRRLHNEELHDLFPSLSYEIKEHGVVGACGMCDGEQKCVQSLMGKPKRMRLFGRPVFR